VSHPFVAKVRGEQVETFPPTGRKEAHRAAGKPAAADVGSTDTPAVTPNRRRTGKPATTKGAPQTPNGRHSEPFLTVPGWLVATKLERVKFVNGVGWLEIVDALKGIEPALDLLNMAWEATGHSEQQAFAKARLEELNALAKGHGGFGDRQGPQDRSRLRLPSAWRARVVGGRRPSPIKLLARLDRMPLSGRAPAQYA
jgi:hypothetical protein